MALRLKVCFQTSIADLCRNNRYGKQDKKMFFFDFNGCWHMLRQDGAATMLRRRFQLEAKTQTQEKQTVNELYEFI